MESDVKKSGDLTDVQKIQLQFIIEEFKAAQATIVQQLTLQANIAAISGSLLAGFVGAAVILLKETSKWENNYGWLLTSFSLISGMLGLWCLDKDHVVLSNAFFIRDVLKNHAVHVIGEWDAKDIFSSFQYLGYNWKEYGYMEWGKRMSSLFPHFLFISFSLVPLLAITRFSFLPGYHLTSQQRVMYFLAAMMQYWLWRCEWLTVMKYAYLWSDKRPHSYENREWIRGFFGRWVQSSVISVRDFFWISPE